MTTVLNFLVILSDSLNFAYKEPLLYLPADIKDLLKIGTNLHKHVTKAHSYSEGHLKERKLGTVCFRVCHFSVQNRTEGVGSRLTKRGRHKFCYQIPQRHVETPIMQCISSVHAGSADSYN